MSHIPDTPSEDHSTHLETQFDGVFIPAIDALTTKMVMNSWITSELPENNHDTAASKLLDRTRAFASYIFKPKPDTKVNPLAQAFTVGTFFTRYALGDYFRMSGDEDSVRALDFSVGEVINLEGQICGDPDPKKELHAYVADRYIDPYGEYIGIYPHHVEGKANRITFELGIGFGLTAAQDVVSGRITIADVLDAEGLGIGMKKDTGVFGKKSS